MRSASRPLAGATTGGIARRTARLAARLLLALAGFAAGLALTEVWMRLSGRGIPERGPSNALAVRQEVAASEVPGLLWALKPGSSDSKVYPGAPGEPDRAVEYRINPQGFRGPPFSPSKPAGTLRIAALGDSFTFGTGVAAGDTWPAALERLLAPRHPERRVEVLNCGVFAYNTRQEVALLRSRVLAFEPDLVLLCAYINDASAEEGARAAPRAAAPGARERWELEWIARLGLTSGVWAAGEELGDAQRFTMGLRRRSRLADVLAHQLYGWLYGRVALANYRDDWRADSPGWIEMRAALADFAALAAERDFEAAVLMYPDLSRLDRAYPFEAEHAVLAGACAELGLRYVDLFPALAGEDARRLRAHAHDHHPSPACHAIVASYLAAQLTDVLEELATPRRGG
jgi:lysophospholipase L1-like esterase